MATQFVGWALAEIVGGAEQSVLCVSEDTWCTSDYGKQNQFRRNPPLRRRDGEEPPFAGHALELVSAAVFELEP